MNECIKEVSCHVPEQLIKKLSDVESSQGVVGMFYMERLLQIPRNIDIALVCDGISDPGNMGTLIRTARGLGMDAVIALQSTDPYSPKCLRLIISPFKTQLLFFVLKPIQKSSNT